ncbi:MBL fold metallo-hydrolase [Desulfopila sp. IMCC35008]|uniref:MBL fold metallo-hydrolase n=1 Tax=Desulfopila sp. IMCC35008 TaxID=2653858 RepID=UPI0013D716FC|nr:MBL fold metallo-hydrolase [Desulfopila sp. IMCC35008]
MKRTPSGEKLSRSGEVAVMEKMSLGEHLGMYKKFFFEKGQKFPAEPLSQEKTDLQQLLASNSGSLKAAWLGHSSLLINIDGFVIVTDPLFERKVSPVGPTRFNGEFPVDIADIPFVNAVIISHNHYDHLNKYSIRKLKDKTNVFIVPLRVGQTLIKWGVAEDKIVELDWWGETHPHSGLTIAATPSQHFSGRGLFDRNKTMWASWVIATENHKLFFSGDSGYFDGFREIGEKYGPFDIAFMECGAYNERWPDVHMFPEQTVQAFTDLDARILQPIHWATFNLSLHAWYEPIERLIDEAWNREITVSVPMIGQLVDYNKELEDDKWWVSAMELSMQEDRQPNVAVQYSVEDRFMKQE